MNWNAIKKDMTKGLTEGFRLMRDGADIAAKKASELTEEGQRRVKIFQTKREIHNLMADIGATIYSSNKISKELAKELSIAGIIKKIGTAEKRLHTLEKKKGR